MGVMATLTLFRGWAGVAGSGCDSRQEVATRVHWPGAAAISGRRCPPAAAPQAGPAGHGRWPDRPGGGPPPGHIPADGGRSSPRAAGDDRDAQHGGTVRRRRGRGLGDARQAAGRAGRLAIRAPGTGRAAVGRAGWGGHASAGPDEAATPSAGRSCPETSQFLDDLIAMDLSPLESPAASEPEPGRGHPRGRRRRGRPTVMTPERVAEARQLLPTHSMTDIARKLGVSRATLYAHRGEIAAAGATGRRAAPGTGRPRPARPTVTGARACPRVCYADSRSRGCSAVR